MNRRWMQWMAMAVLALPAGCRSDGSGGAADAVLSTTLAIAASGISRSKGDCYAACPTGTTCDHNTGYCVSLPCRGQCKAHEQCVEDGIHSKCIALGLPGENVTVEPNQEAKTQP
ncbi:hypothetical protein [Hyalangium versicolor]|uniref:hypothetical protein n=1 Tax=Hyalangium versicolor TaxID=2861190 RepID=UPI001CCCC7E9|nr:hypothetical protein [Hyalangium versicolor]